MSNHAYHTVHTLTFVLNNLLTMYGLGKQTLTLVFCLGDAASMPKRETNQ